MSSDLKQIADDLTEGAFTGWTSDMTRQRIESALRSVQREALEEAAVMIGRQIQQWLAQAQTLPVEERVGYPPFTLMMAQTSIRARAAALPDDGAQSGETK